jgi:hypothetical protein
MSKAAKKSTSSAVAASAGGIHSTVVHPLVLLAVVDHYARVAEGTARRVMGVLLGQVTPDGTCFRRTKGALVFCASVSHPCRRSVRRDKLLRL